jgi:hypothetical protein
MKQKKAIQILYLRTMLVFLLSAIVYPTAFGFELVGNDSTHNWVVVEFNGEWVLQWRSLANIPTAYINENVLVVEDLVEGRDLTVNIIDSDGQVVYEDIINELSSSSVMIVLDTFPGGNYTLELRNSFGGYLSGDFVIY